MIIDGTYRCHLCGTYFLIRESSECPKCHRPMGSIRCPECANIINEYDNFCSHCGADRRWITFECPHCGEGIKTHRWPGKNDEGRFLLSCPKCGTRFLRPDVRI